MTQHITVTTSAELGTATIADLFDREFAGWCPVCKNVTIDDDEVICNHCFKEAMAYRRLEGC